MQIKFANPVFHTGTNITVRYGDKWKKMLSVGDKFEIVTPEGVLKGHGTCNGFVVQKIKELSHSTVVLEHDPACQTIIELYLVMKLIYPEITADSEVIAIAFKVNDLIENDSTLPTS